MPVFTKVVGTICHVVVDGDYTPAELRRVGGDAVRSKDTPRPVRVLLDMSGAAGLAGRSPGELRETAGHFGGLVGPEDAVAILAPDDLTYGMMRMAETFFASHDGVAGVFRTRAEALEWLATLGGDR